MRKGKLCHRDHLNDVAFEYVFRLVEIGVLEVLVHVLLGSIVDEHIDVTEPVPAKSVDMILQ